MQVTKPAYRATHRVVGCAALSGGLIAGLLLQGCTTVPGTTAGDAPVVRHARPGSTAPTAAAVEIRGDVSTVYVSGHVRRTSTRTRRRTAPTSTGSTPAQTVGTLQAIERTLAGLGLGDVVKVQVFVVGDPALGGRMDNAGFNEAFAQFFGTATQPNRPSRSVFQIVALSNPAWRVEIEVVTARTKR